MTEPDRIALMRRILAAVRPSQFPGEGSAECLDDDTIAALADGTLSADARAAALPHVARCVRCRMVVASVARALNDSSVQREIGTHGGSRWRRWYHVAIPAVAAAALLLLVLPRKVPDSPPVHRAPTITASAAPVALAPLGAVAVPRALVWSPVVGADRYRATLFEAGSRVVYEIELADTVAALPDSIRFAPGQPYLWKVEARIGKDRWSASDLADFSVAGGARR